MGGAEQVVEQHVARLFIGCIAARHPAFQQDMAFHADTAGRRRGLAHMVGLHRALGHQHISLFAQRFADQKFQLARLVSAAREPGAVVTLDEQVRTTEQRAQPGHGFYRGRLMAEVDAGKLRKVDPVGFGFQRFGHGHGIVFPTSVLSQSCRRTRLEANVMFE
jgi:hypothetical protein